MTARRMEALVAGVAARARRSAFRSAPSRRAAARSRPSSATRTEKKLSKHKEEFGTTGAIEGVAGPEAANNAAITATLIPLLTLGIPTSNTTAILLGAFQNYGIQPGPQLFDTNAALVWALIASLYIGNVMLLVLNLPLVGMWVKLLKIPQAAPLRRHPDLRDGRRLRHAPVGVRPRPAVRDRPARRLMRRFDFPTAPVVVGMILGPLAEAQMRNALSIGEGSWTIFLQRPGSLPCCVVIVAVLRAAALARSCAGRSQACRGLALSAARRRERAAPSSSRVRRALSAGVVAVGQPPRCRMAIVGQRGEPLVLVVEAGDVAELLAAGGEERGRAPPGRSPRASRGSRT